MFPRSFHTSIIQLYCGIAKTFMPFSRENQAGLWPAFGDCVIIILEISRYPRSSKMFGSVLVQTFTTDSWSVMQKEELIKRVVV